MFFHNIIQPPALLQSRFRPQPSPNYMYFYFHFSLANIRSCFWFVVVLKKSAPIAHNPRWTLTGNREPLLQSSICDVTNKLCCKRCKKFLLDPLPAFDLNITGTWCYLELSRWSWLQPLLTDCTSNTYFLSFLVSLLLNKAVCCSDHPTRRDDGTTTDVSSPPLHADLPGPLVLCS